LGQEFIIKSTKLEDKVNQLLPSQGGFQAGVDLSASTTIIPIVDLTESAEGSNLRQDLQKSLSLTSITSFNVNNTTSTIVNTTGYYRVFGNYNVNNAGFGRFELTDGTTTKIIISYSGTTTTIQDSPFDFIVFLTAGDSLVCVANAQAVFAGCTRQIADIDGNLINPL